MLEELDQTIETVLCIYCTAKIVGNKSGIYQLYRNLNNTSDPYPDYQERIIVRYHGVRVEHSTTLDAWTSKPILFVQPDQDFFNQYDCKLIIFEEEKNND